MVSVNPRVVPFAPVTIEMFLKAVFGNRWREALAAYFLGDPQRSPNWSAYPAGSVLQAMTPLTNNYWDPSLPCPGGGRTGADFEAIYAIVIDDYGVKVDEARVRDLLGCDPSYIIETSPGNFQAGWFIEPQSDRAWVWGLLRALYRALGNTGDNLVKPTTWVRLPVGTNGKLSLGLGPTGFQVKLIHWQPNTRITYTDWIDIEARIGAIIPVDPRLDPDTAMPDPAEIETDLVLKVLRSRGMVLDLGHSMPFGWGFRIECPWAADHHDPRTEADYVPVKHKFKCHHGHCQDRNMGDLREWADQVVREDSGGLETLAGQEFDAVDPAAVPVPASYMAAFPAEGGAIDLWDQRTPPVWPGGVLPPVLEDTLAELSRRDGLDLGALGATMITAASGAADKRSLLTPYAGSRWQVRPVLWTMLIAETGQRKTGALTYLLDRLRRLNAERMQRYSRAMTAWRSLPAPQRQGPAPTVAALLAEDVTVERLQELMAGNPRGLLFYRDELAGMFDFGRYSSGPGTAERTFFLETNEGGPTTIARMTRTTVIDNCALAILGGTQPQKLAEFKGLSDDGLLSRFATVLMPDDPADDFRALTPPDISTINIVIDRLLLNGAFDDYHTDAAGEDLIRETRSLGKLLARRPDSGVGFRGFMRKLHGVHARAALVLHLIDGGHDQLIPATTVARAERYVKFLFGHAEVFYAGLPGSADTTAQAIGSFLLRRSEMKRVTAGQLRRDIAACRSLRTLKEIQDAVFLLVIGGWLQPETNYPSNHAWRVRPGLGDQFTARKLSEIDRVEQIKQGMNQLGRYR